MENETKHHDVFSIVTDRIIELLQKGTVPWQKPWAEAGIPQNLITRIPYRGVNLLLLASFGFSQNLFITWKQLKELGAEVKKGEKPFPVIFWKWPEKKEGDVEINNKKIRPILRYYSVYNVSQCEGIPANVVPQLPRLFEPIKACEEIVEHMPNRPLIRHVEHEAYYQPQGDYVNMPPMEYFYDSTGYYSALFHELVHATGHESRLRRPGVIEFLPWKLENYSTEELIAEIGACFLQAHAGIADTGIQNSAAYIKGWLSVLREDSKAIVFASTQAQKAVDYILSHDERNAEVVQDEHPTFAHH